MKRFIPFILLFSFLLSACGASEAAPTTPTVSPENIRATANAMVYEMLTQTQAAMPANTPIPPTNTPLPLPTATITLVPTLSDLVASPTSLVLATNTAAASKDACDQPLTSWVGESARLTITNNVKKSTAVVSLSISTYQGECGYMGFNLANTTSAAVPLGCYNAWAWVEGKKDFSAGTSFCIKDTGNWQIVIEDGRLILRAGCAPNC